MSPRRILLIEDDSDISTALVQVLTDEGYEVTCALDGEEALSLLRSGLCRPDLILLDLWMPRMDGFEFRARQRRFADMASIPTVVITAGGGREEELRLLGVRDVLAKPLDLDVLLQTIERSLRASETPDGSAGDRVAS